MILISRAPPIAVGDTFTPTEDLPFSVDAPGVLENDSADPGGTLAAVLDSDPSNGALTLNLDGSFVYTPTHNFNGQNSFTYHATDGQLKSETVTVTLNVLAVNDKPVAAGDHYTTTEDIPLIIPAPGLLTNDEDVDGDSLTAITDTLPLNGDLTLLPDGSFVYQPDPGFIGHDSFNYRASDGQAMSDPITVVITVVDSIYTIYLPLVTTP